VFVVNRLAQMEAEQAQVLVTLEQRIMRIEAKLDCQRVVREQALPAGGRAGRPSHLREARRGALRGDRAHRRLAEEEDGALGTARIGSPTLPRCSTPESRLLTELVVAQYTKHLLPMEVVAWTVGTRAVPTVRA
jgi:hypothetical protein